MLWRFKLFVIRIENFNIKVVNFGILRRKIKIMQVLKT